MHYQKSITYPTITQLTAMQHLTNLGYEFIAVGGKIVLERYGEIIKVSKEAFNYNTCNIQRYVIAEKLFKHLKSKNKL